ELRYGDWDDPALQRHVGKLAERALNMDTRSSPPAVPFTNGAIPLRASDIAITVNIVLNSRSGLRRVVFGLEKRVNGDISEWRIAFRLFERNSKLDEYGDALVALDVYVE